MRITMHNKPNLYKYAKFSYAAALWFFLEAYIFGTDKPNSLAMVSNISFIIMFIFFIIGSMLVFKDSSSVTFKSLCQLSLIFTVLSVFWDVNLFFSGNTEINYPIAVIGFISLNLSALLMIGKASDLSPYNKHPVFRFIKQNIGVFIIMLLFLILSIQDFGIWFKSDSYTYYASIIKGKDTWDFTMNKLSSFLMGGHTAYAYSFLLYIGEYIWHSVGNGIRVINLILSEITIFAFYLICKKLMVNKNKLQSYLLTFIFTFSPLLFGISYIMSSDFPLLCFFILFTLCYVYDFKILQWIAALSVCFSKEIGIVILFGFYVGNCIYNYINKTKKYNIFGMIKEAFKPRNILMYSAVFFYIVPIILSNAGWMANLRTLFKKDNATTTTSSTPLPDLITKWHYYIYKLEELYVMNFMWIITLIVLIAVIVFIIRRFMHKSSSDAVSRGKFILPLFFSYVMFILINMAYFTYVHYRYIQLAIFFHVLALGIAVNYLINSKKIKNIVLCIIGVVFICESYITLDPLTYITMPKFNAGNGTVISTRRYFYGGKSFGYGYIENEKEVLNKFYLHEGLDYNRQQLGLQYALEDALTKIDYDSNSLIVLNNFGGWIENTCWSLFGANRTTGYYWDAQTHTMNHDAIGYKLHLTGPNVNIDFNKYSEIYYFDFSFNKYIKDNFIEENTPIDEFNVSNGVWKFTIYKIK